MGENVSERKPPVWHPLDILLYLVPAFFTTVIVITLVLNNRAGVEAAPLVVQILAIALAALTWLTLIPIYVIRILSRRNIKFVTKHGLYVLWKDEKWAVKKEDVEKETQRCHDDWMESEIMCERFLSADKRSEKIFESFMDTLVFFREPAFPLDKRYGLGKRLLAGQRLDGFIQVGLKDTVENSALHHELGHSILSIALKMKGGTRSKDVMEDPHHKVMKKEGLL